MQPFFIKRCYVKEISQSLHRLLSLAALVICIAAEVQAADYYGFKIGGQSVTSDNYTNVRSDHMSAYSSDVNGGDYKVSYDPASNTVTLFNVKINRTGSGNRAILNESCGGLTIVLKGSNWLQANDASPVRLEATTTIVSEEADGRIKSSIVGGEFSRGTQDAITVTNAALLVIRNATLDIKAYDNHCFYGASNTSDNPDDWAELSIDGSNIDAFTSSEDCSCLCRFKHLAVYNSTVGLITTSEWNGATERLASFTKGLGMYMEDKLTGRRVYYNSDQLNLGYVSHIKMGMSSIAVGIPVVASTFTDPKLFDFVDRYFDTNGDGYIDVDEIRDLNKQIRIENTEITSTQGLGAIANYIKEVNAVYESQGLLEQFGVYIREFMLRDNLLTTLDLSGFQDLYSIYCENNQLTSLDLSACPKLDYLSCYGNNIRGAGMDRLIYSLPDRSSADRRAGLNVKMEGLETDNEMTKAQVLVARSKGWIPFYNHQDGTYEEYEGVDDVTESGVAINDVTHFPDAVFRAVVASADIDLDQNGYLSEYEAQRRGALNLQGKGIRNLKGIEYFEDLTRLNCQDNNLTELDLSNNKGIKGVYLYGNNICGEAMDRFIESLPNRPSSDKGSLFVICDGKSLDNVMTNLQVDAAKDKGWNAFKSTNDGASWVFYAGEDVGFAIDEQHFPDENFRAYIQSNAIDKDENGYLSVSERLNVKKMRIPEMGIASVMGIKYFPDMEELDCRSNQLTSLDLQNNPKLKKLYCKYNQLTYLNISQNEALELLSSSHNQLNQLTLENNPNLRTIYIQKNKIRGENMTRLVNSLPIQSSDDPGSLYVFYEEDENIGNDMTYSQMAMAVDRNWRIYRTTDDSDWTIVSLSNLGVPVDEDNFPDEVYRDYVKTFDTDNNGALSDEERAVVTEMNVIGNVADLTGIENFTALKTLEVQNQQLTQLDVSKLTELETLACGGNQLTSLNVSENKKLKSLGCGNNQMETILGLSECTALEELWCDNNQLTTLDLSKNTALATLSCTDNQLTSLDLSKNTLLERLDCYNNQLTTLDLSACTNLEYLYCNNNRLTTILTAPGTPKDDFSCKNNCLKGRVMTDIVNNLPVVEGKAIYFRSMKDTEENEMTSAQVNIATGKGWKVWMDWYYDSLEDYEGWWVELAINETNFPDKNFRSYVGSSIIDKDGDGYLRDEERLSVKKINVGKWNIADLTGIEFFTNLEELNCSNNKIETFDLSKNTALKLLNCNRNLLTRLLLGNAELEEVYCSDNQIEELSLWSPALKRVECYLNMLKEEGSTVLFISDLPQTEGGIVYFHYDGDENTISDQQVIAANKKGWKVFVSEAGSWREYKAYVKGDADGDGVVDVNDVTTTINHILGKPVATFIPEAANVDGDDTIDVNDVQGIINIALGKAGD